MNRNILYYESSAAIWEEALPLGNGKLGAMVFGGADTDRIALNYDELWTGFPRNDNKKEAYKSYFKAKELALQGKLLQAEQVIDDEIASANVQAYMPMGDMYIEKGGAPTVEYKRALDIDNGIATVKYKQNDTEYTWDYFTSHPDKCMVIKAISDKKNSINFKLCLTSQLKYSSGSTETEYYIDGECPFDCETNRKTYPERNKMYSDKDDEKSVSFRTCIKIVAQQGDVTICDTGITVSNADSVLIILTCESSFNGYNKHPYLNGKEYKNAAVCYAENASAKTYEELLNTHTEDYKKYYDRVKFEIDGCSYYNIPTNERLIKFKNDKEDAGLYVLLFNYGRYLTIAGSREDSQAMNLQGIWNDKLNPPWGCDYTVNINTEMNYFPTLMCDLAPMHLPLIKMTEELCINGKETAREYYNASGFCCHHNTDIWRAAQPVLGRAQWLFWPMAGGWFCHHVFEHYEYTCDTEYLEKTAMPIMTESAKFYLDLLTEDKNGYLIFAPSTSPENSFLTDGEECSVSETTCMTMSIIRELFENTLKSAEILKCNNETISRIKQALPKLLPIRIDSTGRIMEWYEEYPEPEPHHRHVSHLYALHPARLISPDKTPELANAAKNTLIARGDDGTGWSLGWKINFWARLKDGNHAVKLIDMQLRPVIDESNVQQRGGGSYPNLFDAHPPFQIDGNFGAVSGIAEMLLQSDGENIYLLPALPDSWKKGSIKGLKAKGNCKVDIEWEDCKITSYKITGKTDNINIIKCR